MNLKGGNMNYYSEIKNELINNEITKKVKDYSKNRSDLTAYYNVGKLLSEAGKQYGEGIIKEYSKRLTNELGRGYTITRLKYMRRYYEVFEKGPTLSDLLSYSHYCELIWFEDINKINYYIKISVEQNLSVRQLRERIKNNEYERLDDKTKQKLISSKKPSVVDFIKNPIAIKNTTNKEIISEKVLQKVILENIPAFLKELGNGFTFVENEYKIKIGNNYNYIDLLLYNYKYNCFVVVELKVTELKKEHIGQIEVYMNYIDKNIREINQDKTIGIIICKKNNRFLMEYCSDSRILAREYQEI
jgi:predicted nuclease of restriction endonuclease-like (RecB) superfamily